MNITNDIVLIALSSRFETSRFAPNKRWHIDTVLRVLKLAGNYVREEMLASFIRLVTQTSEMQGYTVQKLYVALKEDISQESLTLAGVWVIGEYGDILVRGGSYEEEELAKEVSESDVIDLLESILAGPFANQVLREYIITALMKLTSRFSSSSSSERVKQLLVGFSTSIEVEIQQRAVEFTNLFQYDEIRPAVLERMPVMQIKETVIAGERLNSAGKRSLFRYSTFIFPTALTDIYFFFICFDNRIWWLECSSWQRSWPL